MSLWARCSSLVHDAFSRRRMERDMDAELRHHLSIYTEDLVRRGIPREQAERQARIEFGNLEPLKEECRQARGLRLLDETTQDLRYAVRMLRKSPGFAAIAVLTLALGIGANTSIFSVVNTWILKPLPYPNPDQLVTIFEIDTRQKLAGSVAAADLYDWRSDREVFDAVSAWQTPLFTLMHEDQPEQVNGARVNPEFFRILGIAPRIGRGFLPEEDSPNAAPVAILSHEFWQSHFGGDPGIAGKAFEIDGRKVTVVGILPPNFHLSLLGRVNIYMPLSLTGEERANRRSRYLDAIARLKPGVSFARADLYLKTTARRLETAYPASNAGRSVELHTLRDEIGRQGGSQQALIVFWLVGCVLLIACGNVANLVVGRAVSRQKEMAVRLAIGAGRGRLLRQLLIENLVLFLMAGALSVLFATWGVHWIAQAIPAEVHQYLPNAGVLEVDLNTLLYTFGIALVTGLAFGFAPAFRCWAVDVNHGLKETTSRASAGSGGTRLKNCLTVFEVALAMVVLVTAGLLAKGLVRMYSNDPGFQPDGVVAAQISLSGAKYQDPRRVEAFYAQALEQVRLLPGVTSAAAGVLIPYSDTGNNLRYAVDGRPTPAPADLPYVRFDIVSPGYFNALGIALLGGRSFSDQDQAGSLPVAVINQAMARRQWPAEDPVGKRIRYGAKLGNVLTIVGVVRDTKGQNDTDTIQPQAYVPYRQLPARSMRIVLRTNQRSEDIASQIRHAVMAVDKGQSVANVQSLQQIMAQVRSRHVIVGQITIFFAGLSLFLAALGIYGVMAYSVTARNQEFGIRLALGAARSDLASLVVGQGLKLAIAGLTIGLAAALAVTRLMTSILYQVSPNDAATFTLISGLLLAVAALACYLPARRASNVDPNRALRYE
ncbi:MAG: ABC transporter permease [Acidobacteriia bacterium]|nr:ABC transporter permease [Terriglobia bacterium]